uniref:Phospholysine phosphohistidine inorganic pyrophosphate phosphatase n=1 Tax=Timema tahoe TaxID=61484 RepID=A0A7R9NVX7_9NEOP|nr:unnamed protein product [Timema tahoe]
MGMGRGYGQEMDGCGQCMKYSMFIANFIIFIGGVVVLSIGVWTIVDKSFINELLGTNLFIGAVYILIATGALVAFIAFFGCLGAAKEIKCMLLMYFMIVFIIFVTMLVGGILGYVFKEKVQVTMEQEMQSSLKMYTTDPDIQKAWDVTQTKLHCCGVSGSTDWTNVRGTPPDSCCKESNTGSVLKCTAVPLNLNTKGCLNVTTAFVKDHATILGGAGIGVACIMVLYRLRQSNIPIKFVTNTTKESRRCLHERLVQMGFDIEPQEIWTSLWAARDLVTARNLRPLLMLDDSAMEDFVGLSGREGEYDSVVVGLAPEKFNYSELNKAFRVLLGGVPLIAIHESRYFKQTDGLVLGPGPFVKGLEYAAGCKAEVLGKPNPAFFKSALGDIDPSEAVMIGDDVAIDIQGAMILGMKGILLQTGKYRPGDENKIVPAPTIVCTDFSQAVDILLK